MARAFVSMLPQPRTPLLGREREIALAVDLLRSGAVPLLTLIGPGGVGKTRLAQQIALELEPEFADGVVFVPLAAVRDANLVLPTIARALGVPEQPGVAPGDGLARALMSRQTLLVLDNLEHVRASAPALSRLLAACPEARILATSRTRLRLAAEHLLPVPTLPTLDPAALPPIAIVASNPAVALFVQRARQIRPEFPLNETNQMDVAEIVARLDGLPLALELAAARLSVLSLPALLARLNRRLQLLIGGTGDLPPRLRSLSEATAWSYDLLTPGEQRLFRWLAVFTGGFDIEAAAALGGTDPLETLNAVRALVEQSLVLRDDEATGRYAMLETIREYGLDRLATAGEEEATRRAHAVWVLNLAERAEPELRAAHQGAWLDRLERELPNIRAALTWSHEHDPETALRLAAALNWFWYLRGYLQEGRHHLDRALATGVATGTLTRARALNWAAGLARFQEDPGAANIQAEAALAIARDLDDASAEGYALLNLGSMIGPADPAGDLLLRQAHDRFQTCGEAWGIATSLGNLMNRAIVRSELDRAESLTDKVDAAYRAIDERLEAGLVTVARGEIARARGDLDGAARYFEEALGTFREFGDRNKTGYALNGFASLELERGALALALALCQERLELFAQAGLGAGLATTLATIGIAAALLGDVPTAARLLGASEQFDVMATWRFTPIAAARTAARIGDLRDTLLPAHEGRWSEGRDLSPGAAVAVASAFAISHAGDVEASSSRPPHLPASALSSRERDVLRLLVDGASDRAIAGALFISRKTASNHVANILRKLDVETRAAAAAKAVREGMIQS